MEYTQLNNTNLHTKKKMNKILNAMMEPQFLKIMLFYLVVTFFVGPFVGGIVLGRRGVGHGYLVGGVISLLLWHFYGRRIARM